MFGYGNSNNESYPEYHAVLVLISHSLTYAFSYAYNNCDCALYVECTRLAVVVVFPC